MAVKPEEVKKIAHLARLAIQPNEIDQYTKELSNIINLVEQMNAADTTSIEPMAHPHHSSQRMRIDAITETNQREFFQSIAPQVEAGLYLVPAVIEHEE